MITAWKDECGIGQGGPKFGLAENLEEGDLAKIIGRPSGMGGQLFMLLFVSFFRKFVDL